MATTASLRFHKVASLPTSGYTVGDVYYVVDQGIYVATSTTSCTKFAYANAAGYDTVGVLNLNTVKGVKVNSAAAADTATNYAASGTIASKFTTIDNSIGAINTKIGNINAVVEGKTLKIYKPDGSIVSFTDTDTNTHNSHGHTFTANTATTTASTPTSVAVVSALNAASATTDNLSSTYDMVKVPTLKVTNDLASSISGLSTKVNSLESAATTGMQYKGTTTSVPSSGKVGDVYKVTTAIPTLGAEAGDFIVCRDSKTNTWDVWQANIENNAYFSALPGGSDYFLISDGKNGALRASTFTSESFDAKGTAKGLVDTLRGGSTSGTLQGAYDAAANVQTNLNSHINNKENPHKVSASQVGLGNVTNNRQVVGLASGTYAGHFVTWGADGYTVADSGCNAGSFDAAGTAKGLVDTLRGGSTSGTLQGAYDAAAAAQTAAKKAQDTADGKWTATYATTSTKGIASFNSSNFSVSDGAVSLAWATWATS